MPHLVGCYYVHDSMSRTFEEDNVDTGSKFSSAIQSGSSNQEALPSILSMADKYRYMRETTRKRLAFGKDLQVAGIQPS